MKRHMHQITDLADLRIGEGYAFVYATPGNTWAWPVRFAGALFTLDTRGALDLISRLPDRWGYDLTLHGPPGALVSYGIWEDGRLVDLAGFRRTGDPEARLMRDPPEALLEDGTYGAHRLIVPAGAWTSDGRVRPVDWERGGPAAPGWADEEARLRKKRDAELRRRLGFD